MSNILSEVHPELVAEWSDKNLPLTPDRITYGSNKVVWWKGACGHEWQTSVKARSNGENCPICSGARVIEGINDLATLKPELADEWSSKNDPLKPTMVTTGSHKKVIWQDKYGHEYYTDENGQFTTREYICGADWTIKELEPSEGYLLDPTVHKVGAEPELYTIEHNQTANDVNEQVIKGNIAIIKHTDDGETQIETPEEGAVFEVYLKSAGSFANAKESERDTLICDENGFAQTKDMPYGTLLRPKQRGQEPAVFRRGRYHS